MKYYISYTDNAAQNGIHKDEFFEEEFECKDDREALKKVLEIQEQADYDHFEKDFSESSLDDLKNWAKDVDSCFGAPIVFYCENEDGEKVFDSEMRAEEWSAGIDDDGDEEEF